MADDLQASLGAWRAHPSSETAIELCRAIAAAVADSALHRQRLAEVGPMLVSSHAADTEVMLALGALYLRAGELLLADAVLKRVLGATPHDPRVWRLLGEVFLRAGNARDAVTAFDGAAARGMTDAATAAWRERAQGYIPMQDAQGSHAVAASIAGASGAAQATQAQASQAAAPTPPTGVRPPAEPPTVVRPAMHPESGRTAVLMVPDHGPAETSPDSARTLIIQGGAAAAPPSPRAPAMPVEPPTPALAQALAAAVQRPGPAAGDGAVKSEPTAAAAPPASATAPAGGIPAARKSSPTAASAIADPPTYKPPSTPRIPESAKGNGGGHAQSQTSMKGAVSEGRDILDEISMSFHILRLDKTGLPQSEREMDRYLERLRASQGLVIDEPTVADDRPRGPGNTPAEGMPTFQPVVSAGTLPMTSVRDVLRELEQAGPPSVPGFAAPPQHPRPAEAAGALPKVVVQAPPPAQAAQAPQLAHPGLGAPMQPLGGALPLGASTQPYMQPVGGAPMIPQAAAPSGPPPMLLASRRPPKKGGGMAILVVLLLVMVAAGVAAYVYVRYGAALR